LKGPNFRTKVDPLSDLFVRLASYNFKAYECKNLQALDFPAIIGDILKP